MPDKRSILPLVPLLALITLLFPWLAWVAPEAPPQAESSSSFNTGRAAGKRSCRADLPSGLAPDSAVETLIAAVPDPLQTSLGYEFDRFVEAIERGAESSGYTLHCFDLPWLAWGSAGDQVSLESRIERGEQEPGRILFRGRDGATPPFLQVFLVGEMATRGLHTVALARALDAAGKECPPTSTHCQTIRILGPAFSGSVSSLSATVRDWLNRRSPPRPLVRIISGSATSVRPDDLRLEGNACSEPKGPACFHATVYPDDRVLAAFISSPSLLKAESDEESQAESTSRRIAVLVEGNTVYGNSIAALTPEAITHKPSKYKPTKDEASKNEPSKAAPSIVAVPFPLHISSVREAYERRKAEAKKAAGGSPVLDRVLPLLSEKTDTARDVLPSFSELDTNSVELILSRILTTIARERIEYVGVFATDVKDRLFLAEEVLAHCPNTTVFTFDADLLYGRSDALRGMLVYSAYPLFAMNQRWSYPFGGSKRRLQFISSNAQGVYNATVALLGHDDESTDDNLLEYGEPFGSKSEGYRPPLWLSVVGRSGLWPVRYSNGLDSSRYLYEARHQVKAMLNADLASIHSSLALCSGAIGGLAGTLVFLLLLRPLGLRLPLLRRLTRLFPSFDFETHPEAEAWLALFACSGAVTILSGLAATVFFAPVKAANSLQLPLDSFLRDIGWMLLVPFLGLGTTTLVAWAGLLRTSRGRPRAGLGAVLVSAMFAMLAYLGARYALGLLSLPPQEAAFFFMRAADLGNGVSPLAPLLILGVSSFFWSFSDLRRVRLNDDLQDVPLLPATEEGSLSSLAGLEATVRDRLSSPAFRVPGSAFVILLPVAFWSVFAHSVRSLDGTRFDVLAGAWFVLLYVSIAMTFLRSVMIWSATQRILTRLAFHPLADAFSRLPTNLSWSPMMGLVRRVPKFADIEASVRYARVLLGPGPESEALGSSLLEALASEASGDCEGANRHKKDIRNHLRRISGDVARELEPHWSLRGPHAPPENERVGTGEEFLASRVAAFLRHVFAHLRNLLLFVSFGLILLLGVSTSYPFQPRQLLLTFQWTAVLSVVVAILSIFVQMDRDRVLSDIARTPPGRLTWSRDFVSRLITFVVLPILGLASVQFPGISSQIATLLQMLGGAH